MAELKARKAREAEAARAGKDPAEKTGKFWDGFRWVEHTPASQLPSNPATRKERRSRRWKFTPDLRRRAAPHLPERGLASVRRHPGRRR